jgi:MFS family permease
VTSAAGERLVTRPFVLLVAAGLAFFTAGGAVLPVASQFAEGPLDATTTGVGIAIGAFAIGSLLLRPVVGWGSDRFGRRPMLLFGALLSAFGLALHLFVDSLPMFVVARVVLGAAEAFFFVGLLAAAADLAPEGRQGEAFNLASLALYIGLALGPPIGETVLGVAGFQAVWIVCIGLTVGAAALSLLVPETAPAVLAAASGEARPVRARLFHPAGLFPGLVVLLGTWGMAGYFAFVPLHAREIGMSGSAVPLAVYAVLVVVLRLAFAKLPDQIGAARLSGTALVVGSVGLLIIALIGTPVGLVVGSAVFAFGMAFMMPALLTLAVSRVEDTERGAVVGTTSLFLDLSFGLSPAFLGAVADSAGYVGAFLVSAGAAAVGALLIGLRRRSLARPVIAGAATLDG